MLNHHRLSSRDRIRARACGLVAAVTVALAASGCASPEASTRAAALTTATITTDATQYTPGQNVQLQWTGLPGNVHDWVAIELTDPDVTHPVAWMYTGGAATGATTFIGPSAPGSYVARAFLDDSYTALAESAPFTVAVAGGGGVTTDASNYRTRQPIAVAWTGLPGHAHDWIALAPAGSPTTTVTTWAYTAGRAAGDLLFSGLATGGSYVARAFVDDSYSLLAESAAFTVTASNPSITTDQTRYALGATVEITWSGLPASPGDWLALSPETGPVQNVLIWQFLPASAGTTRMAMPSAFGNYVIRAFAADTYVILGQSAPFALGFTTTTDQSTYLVNQAITAAWTILPDTFGVTIELAPAGSALGAAIASTAVGGALAHTFAGLTVEGSYVARLVRRAVTPAELLAESAPFTVSGNQVVVTTDQATYRRGDLIGIRWINLPGNATDWVGFAPVGSPNTTVVNWAYTNGAINGTTAVRGTLIAGTYVARAFTADSYNKVGESAPFVVQ